MRWPLLVVLAACRSDVSASTPVAPARPSYTAPHAAPVLAMPLPSLEHFEVFDDEPRIGGIAGLVVDTAGEPIPGVTLLLSSEAPGAFIVISEEDGSYLFDDVAPDDYLVTLYYLDVTAEYRLTVEDALVELSPTIDTHATVEVVSIGCGGGSMNNTYFVDGIDTAGLTFEE